MRIRSIIFVIGLAIVCGAACAQQEESEPVLALRQQIERLNLQVAQLEAELTAAQAEAVALQRQVQQMTLELAEARTAAASNAGNGQAVAQPPRDPIDPATLVMEGPRRSPEAIIRRARELHADKFGTVEGFEKSIEQTRYLRELASWSSLETGPAADLTGAVRWVGIVEWITPRESGVELRVAIIDVANGELSSQRRIDFVVSDAVAAPLVENPAQDVWLFEGFVRTTVRVNPDREEQGYFDYPPFVGYAAELEVDLDVIDLTPLSTREAMIVPAAAGE